MRHAGTQDIETPRLLLRRLLPEDAPQMYANWASDPEVTRYLRWEPHKSPAETRELLAAWALLYPNPDYYQWAMVEKATGQVFGSISLYNSLPGEPQQKTEWPGLDLTDGVWEPGYCIGRGSPRRRGVLVHPHGQPLAGLRPCRRQPRQRPGDGKSRLCVPPQHGLPQIRRHPGGMPELSADEKSI